MKQAVKYFLLLFFIVPLFAPTKGSSKNTEDLHSKLIVQKDTVLIIRQVVEDNITKNYEQILEKTNNQLSLWWNPYGILISVLGILFTFLTIISAVIIYRQSKEHKELIKESIIKYEKILNQLIEEKNKQLKEIDSNLENLITDQKEKLKTADEENKKAINEVISKLQIQKESIDTKITPIYVIPEYCDSILTPISLLQNRHHKCSKCGFGYFVKEDRFAPSTRNTSLSSLGSKTISCPKCGNAEIYT